MTIFVPTTFAIKPTPKYGRYLQLDVDFKIRDRLATWNGVAWDRDANTFYWLNVIDHTELEQFISLEKELENKKPSWGDVIGCLSEVEDKILELAREEKDSVSTYNHFSDVEQIKLCKEVIQKYINKI